MDEVFVSEILKIELISDDGLDLSAESEELTSLVSSSISTMELFLKEDLKVEISNFESIELGLEFCSSEKIKEINTDHRGKEKATDVLSFPIYENLRDSSSHVELMGEVIGLGDILICMDVAKKQAKEANISLKVELTHLLLHGFLHICGYDHEISDEEEKIMFDLEDRLVRKIVE